MKRIVYYIVQATSEENEKGTFHYSRPIKDVKKAKYEARQILNDFVVIEKHHEYYQGDEYKSECAWEIDHNFKIENIEY